MRRNMRPGILLVCTLFVAAACGGSPSGGSDEEVARLKIGLLPIAAVAPVYLGMEKGFFAEQDIELEPVVAQAGASIIPAVVSGEEQLGFANVVSQMLAADEGLPIRTIAQGSQAGSGRSAEFEAVVVADDSPIREPEDLEGKTVAVNALNNIGGVLIKGALEDHGVDASTIKFTEVAFPDVNAAVSDGRVDAAYQTEPFLTLGQREGVRVLFHQYPVLEPPITIAAYFTTESYLAEHGDEVSRFQRAMNQSLEYASEHEDEVRAIIPEFTEIPPEVAQQMALPSWDTDLDPAGSGLDLVARLSVEQGLLSSPPDLDEMIAPAGQ